MDNDFRFQSFAPEQHPETHFVSICEGQVNRPASPTKLQTCTNDHALLNLPIGATDPSSRFNRRNTFALRALCFVTGMDQKSDPVLSVITRKLFDFERVQGRGRRTGINFHPDRLIAEIRQTDHFTPANLKQRTLFSRL